MKNRMPISFLFGAAVGAVAASIAWSLAERAEPPAPRGDVPSVSAGAPAVSPDAPAVAAAQGAEPEEADAGRPAVELAPAPTAESAPAAEAAPPPPEGAPAAEPRRRGPPRWEEMTDEQREEMRQRFHRMADERAQRMADAFVERNGLAEADGETLLAIADGMNERALERIQRWSDYLQLQGAAAIPKDQGARVMRDLFADLVDGYAELDGAFGTEWREKDPDFDLGQMLSPEVWGGIFRLGGGMGGPGGPPRGPRGPRGSRGPNAPGGPGTQPGNESR